jgi:hypothetical protein
MRTAEGADQPSLGGSVYDPNRYVLHERPLDGESPFVFLVGGAGAHRCEPLSNQAVVRRFARPGNQTQESREDRRTSSTHIPTRLRTQQE